MSVTREEVERVARLAALALETDSLPQLTEQIGRILEYVSQLDALGDPDPLPAAGYPGPRPPLRDDTPQRTPLSIPLEDIAPMFREGLFLVPRLGAVGSGDSGLAEEEAE